MSAQPLKAMGGWRGLEGGIEIAVPFLIAGFIFFRVKNIVAAPSMGKPLTDLELVVFLGAAVAVVAWAVSRQMFMGGRRKPITIAILSVMVSMGAVWGLASSASSGFETACEELTGKMVELESFEKSVRKVGTTANGKSAGAVIEPKRTDKVCQLGGIPGNDV